MATDPMFRTAVAAHSHSYHDTRIKAAFLMNPALGGAFDASGLADVLVPVHVVVTEGDEEAPPIVNGCRYAVLLAKSDLTWIRGPVGHYVFLAEPTAAGKKALPTLCVDDSQVDRLAIHEQVATLASSFFEQNLTAPKANIAKAISDQQAAERKSFD